MEIISDWLPCGDGKKKPILPSQGDSSSFISLPNPKSTAAAAAFFFVELYGAIMRPHLQKQLGLDQSLGAYLGANKAMALHPGLPRLHPLVLGAIHAVHVVVIEHGLDLLPQKLPLYPEPLRAIQRQTIVQGIEHGGEVVQGVGESGQERARAPASFLLHQHHHGGVEGMNKSQGVRDLHETAQRVEIRHQIHPHRLVLLLS